MPYKQKYFLTYLITQLIFVAFNVERILMVTVDRLGSIYIIVSDLRPLQMRRPATVNQPCYRRCFLSHGAPAADQIRSITR